MPFQGRVDLQPFVIYARKHLIAQLPVLYIHRGQLRLARPHLLAPHKVAENQSVLTTIEAHVNATPALEDTNALRSDMRGTTPIPSAPSCAPPPAKASDTVNSLYRLVTIVNTHTLSRELLHYPDQHLASYIINGFTNGFSIGYRGPPLNNSPDNLKSSLQHPNIVTEYLARDAQLDIRPAL